MRVVQKSAIEFLHGQRPDMAADRLVQYALLDSQANVLCPACKLWNTGHGARMMREAVSLMGGYGITEDCPGFLGHKWMDAQLEATYEGPEAVQRRQLSVTMTDELFLAQFREWIREMRIIANDYPGTGACSLATAMQMWLWTLCNTCRTPPMPKAPSSTRAPARVSPSRWPTRSAGCSPPAARSSTCWNSRSTALRIPPSPKASPGLLAFLTDLCHVQSARAAGEVGRVCAELVFGYNRHPAWDYRRLRHLLPGRRPRRHGSPHPRHRQPRPRLYRRH